MKDRNGARNEKTTPGEFIKGDTRKGPRGFGGFDQGQERKKTKNNYNL